MTQQNHRKNVWITPETHAQLIAIGRAHGAAEGREASPGIRVAARYHGRLVEALREVAASLDWQAHGSCRGFGDGPIMTSASATDMARALLKEIEEAR